MSQDLLEKKIPRHVAIIMDGNGRWAKSRNLPRIEGHRAGGKTLEKIISVAAKTGVRYLTVYAFSTENWNRPQMEVSALMKMLEFHLANTAKKLIKNNIRFRVIGERYRLSPSIQKKIAEVEEASKDCSVMDVIVALSYGGRQEIVEATKKIASQVLDGSISVDSIDEKCLSQNMYLPDVPDPDLMIRTSGECRISNFLLWQLAYSEIVVKDCYWPDFDEEIFKSCLLEYSNRNRRFGLTQEQIDSEELL